MSDAATRGFVRGTERDRGFEPVARFLLLIGAERAAPVLARLAEHEVVGITREIAALGCIDAREQRRTMDDFGYPAGSAIAGGGTAAAQRLLGAAFARERADRLLHAALHDASSAHTAPVTGTAQQGRNNAT